VSTREMRFDGWSPLVPIVGQLMQVAVDGWPTVETVVNNRWIVDTDPEMPVFGIEVSHPCAETGRLHLEITPKASGMCRIDGMRDVKPWWRIVTNFPGRYLETPVKIFFPDGKESKKEQTE